MRRARTAILYALIVITGLTSCVDPIAFEAEEEIPKLVIFGNFNQLFRDHEVTISRTYEFGHPGFHVPNAKVEIRDEDGNSGRYYEIDGKYVLPAGAISGEPGKAYKLLVSFENGGRYESTWEIMPEPVEMDKVYWDIEKREILSESDVLIDRVLIDVLVDTPLKTTSDQQAFLRWEVEESWNLQDFACGGLDQAVVCYYEVINPFDKLVTFASVDKTQKRLVKYPVFTRSPAPYVQFSEQHYFNVFQFSMSEETYDYWERVEVVSNPTGSIFDKIPAGVTGNIKDVSSDTEVLGYFEVTAVTVDHTYTTRQEIGEVLQITKECFYNLPGPWQPDYCCFCFVLPNLIAKPAYWGVR